ncbi:MAG TPA: hypothetical protein VEY96_04455, partial [Actinomycetes bacterium]|nr:hypothetical protein [Actinomycetes bacterium]
MDPTRPPGPPVPPGPAEPPSVVGGSGGPDAAVAPPVPHPPALDLAWRVYQTSHLTGSFVLRSGATSGEYFDKYRFESDPGLIRAIAEAMTAAVHEGVEALAGLELGGVPLATVLSQVTGLPALFVRKEAKTYGTCRLA